MTPWASLVCSISLDSIIIVTRYDCIHSQNRGPCWAVWWWGWCEGGHRKVLSNKMIKFDQTLHVKGQYGLIGQPGVLYFTGFHLYGGILRSTTMTTLAPQYGQNGLYHSHVPFL
jgi:hypothetical protein